MPVVGEPEDVPTYDEYARAWLADKIAGVIGEAPLAKSTADKYRWLLGYSLRFFSGVPLDQIEKRWCKAFKAHLLKESEELRETQEAGAELRSERGRKLVPLGASTIRDVLATFAGVLDEAVEDDYIDANPARSKRMRVRVPKPVRTFLEIDELVDLIDAAADQDPPLPSVEDLSEELGETAERVARLAAKGMRPGEIALALNRSKSTVTYHLHRLGIELGHGYVGRKLICALTGFSGPRASEICDLKIKNARLHNPEGMRFQVTDAKTRAGIRNVEVSPDLGEICIEHIDRLRRAGIPTGPDDYLIPNLRGGRISRQRVRKVIRAAAELASERRVARGLPPLPKTTPHTLRRTYISIALIANEYDVKFVMSQVGHSDSKMTTDVYAQLEQRKDRRHGTNFDFFVQRAREQLANLSLDGAESRRSGDEVATATEIGHIGLK